jgi:lipopolysaccharide/colanic/teichoic acid biosynthesis glycosyltransferase
MSRNWYVRYVKRCCDLLVAAPACVALSPLFLLTAGLVHWDSPGPALFVQERAGRDGRTFHIFKFRTMTHRPRTPDREIIGRDSEVTRVGY